MAGRVGTQTRLLYCICILHQSEIVGENGILYYLLLLRCFCLYKVIA